MARLTIGPSKSFRACGLRSAAWAGVRDDAARLAGTWTFSDCGAASSSARRTTSPPRSALVLMGSSLGVESSGVRGGMSRSVRDQVLDDGAERERGDEGERADDHDGAYEHHDEERIVRGQGAAGLGDELLFGQRSGDGE